MTANEPSDLRSRVKIAGLALVLGLAGCSGSGSGSDPVTSSSAAGTSCTDASSNSCGTVLVALTDAEGDFTSYTVDISSISLERADGSHVETLPQTARVDFAELTGLSELVSAATLPPGEIVGGTIRIDYADAEIFVESDGTIVAAEVYDTAGVLLTRESPQSTVEFEFRLPERNRLAVTRDSTTLLSIDFDLAASHSVDTSTTPARVVARPYLVAETVPVDEKELRVRGSLVGVDTAAGTYDVRLRPGHHRLGDYGGVTVETDDGTQFEIDNESYLGHAGLEALAAKPAGTLTVAFGILDLGSRRFTAELVHAGDSLGGARYSAVTGNIISRSGNRLVVKGAIAIHRDRRAHYQRTVIVNVGPGTGVSKAGDPGSAHGIEDLSVGQRITALGEFSRVPSDGPDPFGPDVAIVLDATEARVRMLATRLSGTVNRVLPGQIDVELETIDRLGARMFDFSGTGVTADYDADPANYEIATATLPLDRIEVGRPILARGFVTAFGAAPPDFEGRTLIGPADLPAVIGVGWGAEGTGQPFSVMNADSLVVNLDNPDIGLRHHLLLGPELIDLYDLPASPGITESNGRRVYGLWEPGHIELFVDFAAFVDELALRLSQTDHARALAAHGHYSELSNTLTANRIVLQLLPAAAP